MTDNPIVLLTISIVAASIPVGVWLYILFSKFEKSKKIVAIVFALGCLTAPALLGLQYLWDIFPEFNLNAFIENNVQNQNTMFLLVFILFAAMEEIIKIFMVRVIDKKTLFITTINNAILYSIASALGFSFVENIYYLYQFWPSISSGELVSMYIFRSVFTACAHMIFSGVLGYYYGIGKYSITISAEKEITGEHSFFTRAISKIFDLPISESYRQKFVIKGLLIAIGMHATYNYVLQFNFILPCIIFVILGYIYLRYLLNRKAGHLVLTVDPTEKNSASMGKKDEDVVVDLLGMWFNDKRYVDVIHVCERLLQRDPDNNVVKLFKAKALDQIDEKNTYHKILGSVLRPKEEMSEKDRNTISKYTTEKEMFNKVKEMIKKQLVKEGKEFEDFTVKITRNPETTSSPQIASSPENSSQSKSSDILEKYTGEGTFKLK